MLSSQSETRECIKHCLTEVGSSKKTNCGELIISTAMESRFLSPPEIPRTLLSPTIVSADLDRPTCAMRSSTISSLTALEAIRPNFNSTRKFSVSRTVMCGKKTASCSMKADGNKQSPSTGCPLIYRCPSRRSLGESFTRPASA